MMHHRIIHKTNNDKSLLTQGPGRAARLMQFRGVGLLGLVLILGVLFVGVVSAQAASGRLLVYRRGDEIMPLASHVDSPLVEGQVNPAVPLGQGPDLKVEIEQYPYAYVPNNSGSPPPPAVSLVHAKVTNSGGNATNVTVELNKLSGLQLLDNEDSLRHPPDLAHGDTYHAYWFVTCPSVCGGGSYRVTVRVNNIMVDEEFHSVSAKKVQATGSGANLESLSGCDTVTNNVFSMTVAYTGLQDKQEVFFGPVGNTDFLPSAYRLVDSKVSFAGQDFDNELYFATVDGDSAEVTYYFEIVGTPGPGIDSPLCPYVAHYHNANKAATFNDYCSQTAGFICIPSNLPFPKIEVTKSAVPTSVDEPGGLVTFSVTVSNTGPKAVELTDLMDDIHGDLDGQGSCAVTQTIAVGGAYQCQFQATVSGQPGDSETDTVTATAEDDDGNQTTASDSATVTIEEIQPEISLTKSADPTSVDEPGGLVTFSVTVSNIGAEAVELTDLVDDIHGDLDGQGTCTVPQAIAVGGAYQCQFEATVNGQPGDSETDTVTATAEDDDGNQTTASDSATVTIEEILPEPDTQIIYLPLILKNAGN